jgi:hypothetical protein
MATDGVFYAAAMLGALLVRTGILAPLGVLILAPLWLLKFAPFVGCKRYTLTNKRMLIRRGWRPTIAQELPLADLGEVRLEPKAIDSYFGSADLVLLDRQGKVRMTLTAVPEPSGFRQTLLQAQRAWAVPATAVVGPFIPATTA